MPLVTISHYNFSINSNGIETTRLKGIFSIRTSTFCPPRCSTSSPSMDVDPHSKFINREKKQLNSVEEIVKSGDSKHKVDLVIVAEGYQQQEIDAFVSDAKQLVDTLFSYEPYKSNRDKFNVWLVKSPSVDSGPDNPGDNRWNSTVAGSTFYTFDEERYLTTFDYKALADLITGVPCDALYVLVNSEKYGGGGIFGYYALSSAHNALSPKVFIHGNGKLLAAIVTASSTVKLILRR